MSIKAVRKFHPKVQLGANFGTQKLNCHCQNSVQLKNHKVATVVKVCIKYKGLLDFDTGFIISSDSQ